MIVTVSLEDEHTKQLDVELPSELPVQAFLDLLVQAYWLTEPAGSNHGYYIEIRVSDREWILFPGDGMLTSENCADGARIVIRRTEAAS
ncbi:EsaB/YukD family protein [Paenibacillus turpanensis]|uniref:EsaB/YukD family protein n=1 Tax=Paenibacillus turpanensis TaxID=2689078 RepID=UPI001407DCB2|nr:EsaB/YukD family protein [Paenibacillus turpanensis]